jgi:hypothetical protein
MAKCGVKLDTALDIFIELMFFSSGEVYENPPVCPTVFSSAIEWEQSIIEGHPTHPVRVLFIQGLMR